MATTQEAIQSAPASPVVTPNLYHLNGHHLHVMYSTSGIDGRPHLTYQDAVQTLTFTGDQIRSETTEIGTLVTVDLRKSVDAGRTTFSLLVPTVNLGTENSVPIATDGITTIHRFSIVAKFNQGQTELYSFTRLTGTASFVLS